MTFERLPRGSDGDDYIYFWCDRWIEDRYFYKGLPDAWGSETLSYLERDEVQVAHLRQENIARVEQMFIDNAIETPWTGPTGPNPHGFEPTEADEFLCDICGMDIDHEAHD